MMLYCMACVQVVVATNCQLEQAIVLDEFCHRTKSAFIRADVRGVFASVFCDFGPSHTVLDVDGEPVLSLSHSMQFLRRSFRTFRSALCGSGAAELLLCWHFF